MSGSTADWVSAVANVVLAVAVIWGAGIALRRWPVALRLKVDSGPFIGQSTIQGVEHPPHAAWFVELTLVSGDVAHIGAVRIERFRSWRWVPNVSVAEVKNDLPASLAPGESVKLFISSDKSDRAPMRVRVSEYRSWRQVVLPFLNVAKVE